MFQLSKRDITYESWLKENGFSPEGITYIVTGNSYAIKDNLKENNFKFSPLLRWHAETADFPLPEGCFYRELRYDDVFTWDSEINITFMKEGARDRIESIFHPPVHSHSVFVGEIGDRLQDVPMTLENISGYNSPYGYKWVYNLSDEEGNVYTWFTTAQQPIGKGARLKVSGKIKGHVEYKGNKTTQLHYCKFVEQ